MSPFIRRIIFIGIGCIVFLAICSIVFINIKGKEVKKVKKHREVAKVVKKAKKPAAAKPTEKKPVAVIAFVIDDWGYNNKYFDLLKEIDRPITISVLPDLRYSKDIAEYTKINCPMHDIILHLPMESKTGKSQELNTIKTSMAKEEIVTIIEKDIESIPHLIGISNHQGSKATEDERVMRIVMEECKKKGYFFLDSVTTKNPAGEKLARELKVKYAKRDIFLDITDQTDKENFSSYIKGQLQQLVKVAKAKKKAIGIGHNLEEALIAIRDFIPEIEKQGIKIVPLKEIVK